MSGGLLSVSIFHFMSMKDSVYQYIVSLREIGHLPYIDNLRFLNCQILLVPVNKMLSIHTSTFNKLLLKAFTYDLKNIIFENLIKKRKFWGKEKVIKNILHSVDFFWRRHKDVVTY